MRTMIYSFVGVMTDALRRAYDDGGPGTFILVLALFIALSAIGVAGLATLVILLRA